MDPRTRKELWPVLTNYVKNRYGINFKDQVEMINAHLKRQQYFNESMELNENQMKQLRRKNSTPTNHWINALAEAVRKKTGDKMVLTDIPNSPVDVVVTNEMAVLLAENTRLKKDVKELAEEQERLLLEKEAIYQERLSSKDEQIASLKRENVRLQKLLEKFL